MICFNILFLILSCFILNSCAQKTKNQIDRESAIFPSIIFPRIFDSIATDPLETPVQVRAFFYANLAAYNAWSSYHPTALDIFSRSKFKRPKSEHTLQNKNTAVMFAIWKLYQASPPSFGGPSMLGEYRKLIREQGFDPDDESLDTSTAVGIGNRQGIDTSILLLNDGWNANGDMTIKQNNYKLPFFDYTNYTPKNSPWKISFPFKWQPLLETNGIGFFFRQEHVVPQAASSLTFSISPKEIKSRKAKYPFKKNYASIKKVSKADKRKFQNLARNVFKISEKLTERQAIIAELMDNKVKSFQTEQNPSGTITIAAFIRFAALPPLFDWNLDDDIIFGMAANIAAIDSLALVWKEKIRNDAARPTNQLMEYLFGPNKKVKVWGGPGKKPVYINVKNWQPFFRTMPHSEFPSASACLCEATVEQALINTKGNDTISASSFIPKGSSKFYPGQLPSKDTTLHFNSLKELNRLCGISRLWGGVHFAPAIDEGRKLCKGIGKSAQSFVDDIVAGKPRTEFLERLPEKARKQLR